MKEFVIETSKKLNLKPDLIEKDILLHFILLDLSRTKFVNEFAFKGGSCLIKYYLDYFRFSVDLDFTFLNQNIFEELSKRKTRSFLSGKIDELLEIFENISTKRKLDFKSEKRNRKYVEYSSGGKILTLKIWWNSPFIGETFIKVQINFYEKLLFKIKEVVLNSLLKESRELEFLYPQFYKDYTKPIYFKIYDINEIFCEKIRAILTRKGIKERDFVDIYLISKKFNIDYEDLNNEIIEKTKFSLSLYKRYRDNLRENLKVLSINIFPFGSEDYLLITRINKKEFYKFVRKFITYLKTKIVGEL